jgi:hypothetical protein
MLYGLRETVWQVAVHLNRFQQNDDTGVAGETITKGPRYCYRDPYQYIA